MAGAPAQNLVVRVAADLSRFRRGMTDMDRAVSRSRTNLRSIREEGLKLNQVLGAAGIAAAAGVAASEIFQLGAAVEETQSKFTTVFGESEAAVQSFVDSYSAMAGLTEQEAQGILATTGSIAQGMGFAGEAAASLSVDVVKLAGDFASFNNVPIEDTARAIQAALTGEREQLKRLGVVIREVDVQQRAMALSGKTNAKELTNQEKAAATMALITERAGVAVGDLARTQDSAANQARRLGAELKQFRDEVAAGVLPVIQVLVGWGLKLIQSFKLAWLEVEILVAKLEALRQRVFGTTEAYEAAKVAVEALTEENALAAAGILGLTDITVGAVDALQSYTNAASGATAADTALLGTISGPSGVTAAIMELTNVTNLEAMAHRAAADAANAQADALSRLGGAGGFLTKLSGFLSFIPGLGSISGFLGKGGGFLSSFAGLFANGGMIPAGKTGIVGEAGPEFVSGPATVTPMGAGGDTVVQLTVVTPDGRTLADNITYRQRRDDRLGRKVRIPIPVGA